MCWLQQSSQLWYYPTFLLIPLMIVGGIECFAGSRAWRFLLGFNGAVLGFAAGSLLTMVLGAPILLFCGAMAGAVAGMMLFAGLVPVGSVLFAFASPASLAIVLGRVAGISPHFFIPAAIVAGLSGAVAVVTVPRPARTAITAIAGAQQVASAGYAYSLPYDVIPVPDLLHPPELAAFVVLAAAGLFTQVTVFPRLIPSAPAAAPSPRVTTTAPRSLPRDPAAPP